MSRRRSWRKRRAVRCRKLASYVHRAERVHTSGLVVRGQAFKDARHLVRAGCYRIRHNWVDCEYRLASIAPI